MSAAARTTAPPRALSRTAVEMVESVGQHRLLTTNQIHDLHRPNGRLRWTQRLLAELRTAGLLATARASRGPQLWYVTERGAESIETVPLRAETRRKLLRPEQAAGPLRHHTVAVNDVGIAFVRVARERGDDCGPFSWRHEIAHPLGPPPGQRASEQLIADALLSYQQNENDGGASFHYRFVELDRATMPVDALAGKAARYARLYRHVGKAPRGSGQLRPLWRHRYPVFPGVLLVLAGDSRPRLERRRGLVLRLCSKDQQLIDTPAVRLACCLLDDLVEHGPFAEIFCRPAAPDAPTDWLADATR